MSNKEIAFSKIKKAGNLPALPQILVKLLSLCDDEDVELTHISDIVAKDPAFCTEILRLVNSSHYGFRHSINNIKQAVVYLGAKTIQDLAITISVHQAFGGKRKESGNTFDSGAFWFHSLLCATIAKRLNRETGLGNGDDVYLAGLLHDIGKLLLASTFSNQYKRIAAEAKSGQPASLALEEKYIGINHCEAGSWLVSLWKLQSLVSDAILYHHHPADQIRDSLPLVQVIYCANLLSEDTDNRQDHYDTCQSILSLGPDSVDNVLEGAREEVLQLAGQLGIKCPTEPVGKGKADDKADRCSAENDSEQVEGELFTHIKNVSLLATVLDNLGQASDSNDILASLEKSLNLLFGIDRVMLFLPDNDHLMLEGKTSTENLFYQASNGIRLPIHNSSSCIVEQHKAMSAPLVVQRQDISGNLADLQIFHLFKTDSLLLVSMAAEKKPVGVIAARLSQSSAPLSTSERKLLRAISRQVALRLYMESQKIQQAEQLQAERMAAASLAARKFAHEINNPLGIISNYLTGMKLKFMDLADVQHELSSIDEEIQRISTMLNQMHMFAQAPFSDFEETDINDLIHPLIHLSKLSFFSDPDKNLSFVPGANLPFIKTSRNGIKQILINLLKNSGKAIQHGGRVIVRTKTMQGDDSTARGVVIIVSDTGPGLPDHVRENLYEPLVSTTDGAQSGLGLSIVNKAVYDIGGKLTCSTSSEGTVFSISLPDTPITLN